MRTPVFLDKFVSGKTPEVKPVLQICGFYYCSRKYRDLLQIKLSQPITEEKPQRNAPKQ
jgi:hypothetical protein